MKYCHNCGKQLEETMKFCPHCGSEQPRISTTESTVPVPNTLTRNQRQLHCPHCKSTNIHPTLESQTTDGGALHIPIADRFVISNFSGKTTQHYDWLCQNCGVRFPNIHELENKLAVLKSVPTLSIGFAILAVIATIYYLFTGVTAGLWISIPCVLIFAGIYFYANKKIDSQANEIMFYKKHCFD